MKIKKCFLTGLFLYAFSISSGHTEPTQITVATQPAFSFLPLMIMERDKLVEHRAQAKGLGSISVKWLKVAGPSVMNDGLLSGSIQFAAQGAPSMLLLWDRTRNSVGVKAVAAIAQYPLTLVSRNPAVKSISDITAADKIAVPSIKISTQAILLQMAAAKAFGFASYSKIDQSTISLSYPDAILALRNNTAGVNAMFTSTPYTEQALALSDAHVVTSNEEILGGPSTATLVTSTEKFRSHNPGLFSAFEEALGDAIKIIYNNKFEAIKYYKAVSRDESISVENIDKMLSDGSYKFTTTPQKILATAEFMSKIGLIKQHPDSLGDVFFNNLSGDGN